MIKGILIKVVKNIKFLISLILVFLYLSCESQQEFSQGATKIYDVIFTDGFKNDKVTFYVNKQEIVSSISLISDKSDGVTQLSSIILSKGNYIIVKTLKNKDIKINNANGEITIGVFYKNQLYTFQPQLDKGMYILISANKNIEFMQQVEQPVFD